MKICIFQFDIAWLDPHHNLIKIEEKLKSLQPDVDLLVLPEMYLTGFCMEPAKSSVKEGGEEIRSLIGLAKRYNIALIGSLAINEDGKHYNRVLLLSENGIVGRYDKQFLYSPSGENAVFTVKYAPVLFDFKGWTLLPQVCYDLRFPENVRTLPAPDLLIYMANWPQPRIEHWKALLRARAVENQCYVVGCNRTGTDGNNWEYPGCSLLIQFDGEILDVLMDGKQNSATLNHSSIVEYRSKYKFLGDKRVVFIQ